MAKSRVRKRTPHERPYVSNLELRHALAEKLTERELNALEKQITTAVEIATERAVEHAVEQAYIRHWAITMRVLRDRFGWGKERLKRLWAQSLDYLHDMDSGLITPEEMLSILEREDGIRITWTARMENRG